jgi:hypothetical protein
MKHIGTVNIPDTYFSLLEHLSVKDKLTLISKLAGSIISDKSESQEKPLSALYGAFISDKSADEIIEELRCSRLFNRKTEEL